MIAKHVSMRTVKKSDFAELVGYITDPQSKSERVAHVAVTNCHQEDARDAALEIQATQALNKRAKSDKTYHLIISFRTGEKPTLEVLRTVETLLCEGLGYGEHQRISVVHHDTDNLHIHVAINKIHPTRHTLHDPYNDHKTLGRLCDQLERRYRLQRDNHQVRKQGAENRATDMEHHAGIETLLSWVRRECAESIQSAKTWQELHQVMHANGLDIRAHGNGLIITEQAGTRVKASSVSREFSKAKLEARLGPFEAPSDLAPASPVRQYEPRPLCSHMSSAELYAEYKATQQFTCQLRAAEWAKACDKKNRLIADTKRNGRLKRAAIKLMGGSRLSKKVLYALVSRTLKADIAKINDQYFQERQAIYETYQRRTWADWLQHEARQGNPSALAALRARKAQQALEGDTITSKSIQNPGWAPGIEPDGITKRGTIIYRVGAAAIRDDGNQLNISQAMTSAGLEAALRMAIHRYGQRITVNGSAQFKARIIKTAVAAKLNITFDDEALERHRQRLLNASMMSENSNEPSDRRRINRGRAGGAGSISTRSAGTDRASVNAATRTTAKPNIGTVGTTPPPQARNRLRNLSQLGVVRVTSGSEMLLPSHVPDHLEQQRSQPDNTVRRNAARAGLTTAQAAADKYIAEREEKRLKGFDIRKHKRYNENSKETIIYAGSRLIEGHNLVLLKRDEEIMVLPIDAATGRRLRRLVIGSAVTVNPQGLIKAKGRSR